MMKLAAIWARFASPDGFPGLVALLGALIGLTGAILGAGLTYFGTIRAAEITADATLRAAEIGKDASEKANTLILHQQNVVAQMSTSMLNAVVDIGVNVTQTCAPVIQVARVVERERVLRTVAQSCRSAQPCNRQTLSVIAAEGASEEKTWANGILRSESGRASPGVPDPPAGAPDALQLHRPRCEVAPNDTSDSNTLRCSTPLRRDMTLLAAKRECRKWFDELSTKLPCNPPGVPKRLWIYPHDSDKPAYQEIKASTDVLPVPNVHEMPQARKLGR